MPLFNRNGLDLYYETHGEGFPLLLVSGLGGGTWSWYGQVPFFSRDFRVITFDNRGAGKSGAPPGPYSMRNMAGDALFVLDSLGIGQAFVMGLSMGGMIALELALLAPDRVRALLLGCTHSGGSERIPPSKEVIETIVNISGLSHEEVLKRNLPVFFSAQFLNDSPRAMEEYLQVQTANPLQAHHAFMAQLAAINGFDCADRLDEIRTPALVVTGTGDVLISAENSRRLARRLPNSELVEIPGAGHAIHVECRDTLNGLAHRFFTKHLP